MDDILFPQRVALYAAEAYPSGPLRTATWLVLFSFFLLHQLFVAGQSQLTRRDSQRDLLIYYQATREADKRS